MIITVEFKNWPEQKQIVTASYYFSPDDSSAARMPCPAATMRFAMAASSSFCCWLSTVDMLNQKTHKVTETISHNKH